MAQQAACSGQELVNSKACTKLPADIMKLLKTWCLAQLVPCSIRAQSGTMQESCLYVTCSACEPAHGVAAICWLTSTAIDIQA